MAIRDIFTLKQGNGLFFVVCVKIPKKLKKNKSNFGFWTLKITFKSHFNGLNSFSQSTFACSNYPVFFSVVRSPLYKIYRFLDAGGLLWVSEWNALQHPVAAAFLAALFSDYMLTSRTTELLCDGESYKPADLRKFAKSQVQGLLFTTGCRISELAN